MQIVSFDFGTKKIGIAVGQTETKTSSPLEIIFNKNNVINWKKIESIIHEWKPDLLLVGKPLNMDGSSGRSAQSAKDTSNNIEMNINLPVCLWDERLSTVGAFNLSSQLDINVSKREKKIDENAAAFILQGAIDFLNN